MSPRALVSVLLLALASAGGCGEDTDTVAGFLLDEHLNTEPAKTEPHPVDRGPGSEVDPANVARARVIWDENCSGCHGRTGAGKGHAPPLGRAGFTVKNPRDHIKKIVVEGGAAVGKKAEMPPHPELAEQPQVLEELVTILEGLGPYHGEPPASDADPAGGSEKGD